MATDGMALLRARPHGAPRWRALALAAALVVGSWAAGFTTARLTAAEPVGVEQESDQAIPEFIRPGDHGGGDVKRG